MSYKTIVADPPWPYETSKTGRFAIPKPWKDVGQRGVERMGYGVASMAELSALRPTAALDAHLYLWTTNAFLVEAHELAVAWGFKPKTMLTWVKIQPDGRPSMKTGYYFRGATERKKKAGKAYDKLEAAAEEYRRLRVTTLHLGPDYDWPA